MFELQLPAFLREAYTTATRLSGNLLARNELNAGALRRMAVIIGFAVERFDEGVVVTPTALAASNG
ncbi:hypothetical protein [Pseudomonas farris]